MIAKSPAIGQALHDENIAVFGFYLPMNNSVYEVVSVQPLINFLTGVNLHMNLRFLEHFQR